MRNRLLCVTGCFTLLLFCVFEVQAQYLSKPLRTLTTKDGLPQSFISGLVQDRDGFVWIGTRNGLARYDGIHFKQFQHNNQDTATISSNIIIELKMDKHNRIWIHHEASSYFDCFDPITEAAEHFSNRPFFSQHLVADFWIPAADGKIWCFGHYDGLYRYNPKADRFTRFSQAYGQLANDTVFGLLEDRHNRIWIATRQGLSRYNAATGRFQLFSFPPGLKLETQVSLHERSNGELMMGDKDQLIFFSPVNHAFRAAPLPERSTAGVLFTQTGPDGATYLNSSGIIYRYDDTDGLSPLINLNAVSAYSLKRLLVDRSGLIWLGLNAGGICQVDLTAPAFEVHPNVVAVQYDLLKKEFGLALDKFSIWPHNDFALSQSGYVTRSVYDAGHRLWVALRNRVGYYTAPNNWVVLPPIPIGDTAKNADATTGLRGVAFSPDGRLWIVNENNFIGYFDTAKQQWIQWIDPVKEGIAPGDNAIFTDIKADSSHLWIAGSAGLLRINAATRHFDLLNQKTRPGMLPTNLLLGMEPDPHRPDILWIGSYEGLIRLNKNTLQTTVFSVREGLPDNTIYSIQTDNAGYLWLSTNKGLCRFHPVTHQVRIFRSEDGLPGDEFNRFHHLKLPDGRLAFGGLDGWVLFDPTTIQPDKYQPPVAFTGFQINNRPPDYMASDSLLPRTINGLSALMLRNDQNTLTFEFAGLEFNQPKALQYRYRLANYDDNWIVTDNPVATYTKLPPGHYVLQINCTNTTKQWSSQVRTLSIVILPPWWRTWWAYTLYILAIAGVVYALYRNRIEKERSKQQLILRQKEAEQLKKVDEMKSRFFSNVTHEFRTPLSLILAPAEQMQRYPLLPEQEKLMSTIQRNARQTLTLINHLLDMAKLEADSMKVFLSRGNIHHFVEELLLPFTVAAAARDIQLGFTADTTEEEYLFDADKLRTILTNLLSNAVKFTPAGGAIQVTVEQQATHNGFAVFRFRVQDSGIGIAPGALPHIFNRFYQADNSSTRSYGGTGIGLALAKELAELMQGTLTADSEEKKGSVFCLALPLTKATGLTVPAYTLPSTPIETPALLPAISSENVDMAGKPLVLIVEDNPELNDFIAQFFRQHFRVLTAANGAEGLQLAGEALPDVIISDWMMPEMDGNTLCNHIKTGSTTNHIGFILLTAKATPLSKITGLQTGADDYVTKPFVAEELLLRVKNMLHRQQQLRRYFQQQLQHPENRETVAEEEAPPVHPFLEQLYTIIDDHLDDPEFLVDKLAVKAAVSPSTLGRKLSTLIGLSAAELIKQYRLRRAAEFLKQGMNVTETTYRVGYDSQSHFSTIFKAKYGIAPGEYGRVG